MESIFKKKTISYYQTLQTAHVSPHVADLCKLGPYYYRIAIKLLDLGVKPQPGEIGDFVAMVR